MSALSEVDGDFPVWVLAGLVLTLIVLSVAWHGIGALVFGLFLYYALRPLYREIHGFVGNDEVSAILTLVAFGVPLVLVLGYAGLLAFRTVTDLVAGRGIAGLQALAQPYVDVSAVTDRERLLALLQKNIGLIRSSAGEMFLWGVRFSITAMVTFYLLRDDDRIADWFRESFDDNDTVVELAEAVDSQLGTIYTGNLITMIINGLLATVVFLLFNVVFGTTVVVYPVMLGLLIGVFTLVPAIGIILVYAPYTVFLFVRAFVWETLAKPIPFVFFAVTFVVVDILPDYVIRAAVSGRDLNMGLILLAFILGTLAFGWYGIFLGPILLVLFLEFGRKIFPRIVEGWPTTLASDPE